MNRAVVRKPSPEETEYERYLREIEIRTRHVASLEADLETLKVAVGRFEAEYHARAGVLFGDLDRIRLQIGEYERRIKLLRADPTISPEAIETEIRHAFTAERERIRREDESTKRYQRIHQMDEQRPQLSSDEQAELRRLYRELARRFHPDLARTDDERQRRSVVMQRINEAFRDRNRAALAVIAEQEEFQDLAFEQRSTGDKLVWAIRRVHALEELVLKLEAEIAAIKGTDTYELWQRQRDGEDIIGGLVAELSDDIVQEQDRLSVLVSTYQFLLLSRLA